VTCASRKARRARYSGFDLNFLGIASCGRLLFKAARMVPQESAYLCGCLLLALICLIASSQPAYSTTSCLASVSAGQLSLMQCHHLDLKNFHKCYE